MPEPLTKEERHTLVRTYADALYADTECEAGYWQKHAAATMLLRLLDTVESLEAENARLRPLAEAVDTYYGAFMASSATDHCDRGLKRQMDAAWNRLLDDAALRAAKGEP